MAAAPTTAYDPIRPLDLQDPTLDKLNLKLQNTQSQLTSLGSTINPSNNQNVNVWTIWPQTSTTIRTTMTFNITAVLENMYLQQANMMFVNLDIQLNLGGTAENYIIFSPPNNIIPATNSGNCMSAIAFPASANPLPIYARTQNNGIIVIPTSGGAYPLGLVEILVSGWYRI